MTPECTRGQAVQVASYEAGPVDRIWSERPLTTEALAYPEMPFVDLVCPEGTSTVTRLPWSRHATLPPARSVPCKNIRV